MKMLAILMSIFNRAEEEPEPQSLARISELADEIAKQAEEIKERTAASRISKSARGFQ